MKKIIFLIITAVLVYADITDIISEVKSMENYKPHFKSIKYFNIFGTYGAVSLNNENNTSKNISEKNNKKTAVFHPKASIKIYAVFNGRVNLNGKWYKRGDIIEGYKIIKIYADGVIIKKGSKIKKIFLKPVYIKVLK